MFRLLWAILRISSQRRTGVAQASLWISGYGLICCLQTGGPLVKRGNYLSGWHTQSICHLIKLIGYLSHLLWCSGELTCCCWPLTIWPAKATSLQSPRRQAKRCCSGSPSCNFSIASSERLPFLTRGAVPAEHILNVAPQVSLRPCLRWLRGQPAQAYRHQPCARAMSHELSWSSRLCSFQRL